MDSTVNDYVVMGVFQLS